MARAMDMTNHPTPLADASVTQDPASEPEASPSEPDASPSEPEAKPSEPDEAPSAFQLQALLTGPVDLRTVSLFGLFAIAFLITLHLAKSLLLPIVVACLFTLLLNPTVTLLNRWRLPRTLASGLVLLTFMSILGLGVHSTFEPASKWIEKAPKNLRRVERKVRQLMKPVEEVSQAARQVERLTQMQDTSKPAPLELKSDPSLGKSLFDGTQDLLVSAGVVLILTFFLLSSGDLFLYKLVRMLPRLKDRKKVVQISRQIQRDVSTYLLTISSINVLLAACVGVMAYFMGLPNPVLWGVMAGTFNFVPYLGAIAGTLIVAGASLLTFDEPLKALAPPLIYLALTAIEGSLVTPLALGHRLSLNPVVIFLGLFFWGWIWGVAGALLAVPLLISIKILCDHLEPLEPIGELLGR